MTERVLYESSNGDVWALTRDLRTNTPVVKHQPNISSGDLVSYTDIGQFLRSGAGSGAPAIAEADRHSAGGLREGAQADHLSSSRRASSSLMRSAKSAAVS